MKRLHIYAVSGKSLLLFGLAALLLVLFLVFCSTSSHGSEPAITETDLSGRAAADGGGGKLAIIIDDFGSSRDGVEEMMSIREHLTFAVMPFLQNTLEDAEIAHGKGFEVIVHLSMEPNYGKRSWLGPKPILAGMKGEEIRQIVRDAFDSVPYAAGANIHMGSRASNDELVMSAVLDVIKEKGLYFVDSRTANKPKARKIARTKGIRCYDRDVFLDEQQPKGHIKERLDAAADIAVRRGYAIAAGHVGQEGGKKTAEAIVEMLPELRKRNVELVFVSELNEGISIEGGEGTTEH